MAYKFKAFSETRFLLMTPTAQSEFSATKEAAKRIARLEAMILKWTGLKIVVKIANSFN